MSGGGGEVTGAATRGGEGAAGTTGGDGTCASAAATAACAGAGTTEPSWLSALAPGPEASAPAGASASVTSATMSAGHNPQNLVTR
jgi:hypothetical protein